MIADRKMTLLGLVIFLATYVAGALFLVQLDEVADDGVLVILLYVVLGTSVLLVVLAGRRLVASQRRSIDRLMAERLLLQDQERTRIARTLHDDLGQYLTGIRAQAQSLVYDPALTGSQKQRAGELAHHCETMHKHFRCLLQDLHPLVEAQLGLAGAIRHLAEQWQRLSGIRCSLDIAQALPELDSEQQAHLFRLLQEALNNVARHARATEAWLVVAADREGLCLEVRDNGIGGIEQHRFTGQGIRSMHERARCLGGRLCFQSSGGSGTRVSLRVSSLIPNT